MKDLTKLKFAVVLLLLTVLFIGYKMSDMDIEKSLTEFQDNLLNSEAKEDMVKGEVTWKWNIRHIDATLSEVKFRLNINEEVTTRDLQNVEHEVRMKVSKLAIEYGIKDMMIFCDSSNRTIRRELKASFGNKVHSNIISVNNRTFNEFIQTKELIDKGMKMRKAALSKRNHENKLIVTHSDKSKSIVTLRVRYKNEIEYDWFENDIKMINQDIKGVAARHPYDEFPEFMSKVIKLCELYIGNNPNITNYVISCDNPKYNALMQAKMDEQKAIMRAETARIKMEEMKAKAKAEGIKIGESRRKSYN